MIQSNQKTSLLVPSQLPAFIRDDDNYQNFVLFLQAYYEWMEKQDGVLDISKNLLNYKDIDELSAANTAAQGTDPVVNEFINYFYNDFLSYFPTDILADKTKVIKLARQLYQSKGTPASYQFLFRILYNTDVDFFNTGDAVLIPSSGKWYVAKSVVIGHVPTEQIPNWYNLQGLKLFCGTSKTVAVIENTSTTTTGKIEVFISNIERLFQSGEVVYVLNAQNQYVLDSNQNPILGQIVGQINQIKINPNYRGQNYLSGDPITIYGGLNSNTGHGATATVGQTTTGALQRIDVTSGGFGYTNNETTIIITGGAGGANAHVGQLDTTASSIANVTLIATDYIGQKASLQIGSPNYNFPSTLYATVNTKSIYANSEVVFQGTSLASNTFRGTVVRFDSPNNVLYLQSTTGSPANTFLVTGNSSGTFRTLNSYSIQGANTVLFLSNGEYSVGEIVYQGNYNTPSFYGTVATNDTSNNILTLSNIYGPIPTVSANLTGITSGVTRKLISYYNTSNANTKLVNALTFTSFTTYPIASVLVDFAGGGIVGTPTVTAHSYYESQDGTEAIDLANLGILSPIQIINGGQNYSVNDKIIIANGSGYGANAIITTVSNTGAITGVTYSSTGNYPIGGMGYNKGLPSVAVTSSTGSNAVLTITSTLGTGAAFDPITNRVGTITTINISDPGEDYISAPNVSFKVQDMVVTGVSVNNLPTKGDLIYQKSSNVTATISTSQSTPSNYITINNTANVFTLFANNSYISGNNIPSGSYVVGTDVSNNSIILSTNTTSTMTAGDIVNITNPSYQAIVDSLFLNPLVAYNNPLQSLHVLRVYNYNSNPNYNLPLKIDSKNLTLTLSNQYPSFNAATRFAQNGYYINYGDGTAQGTASFLNGLVYSSGQYLDSTGQPSGFSVLQSPDYNNFTYQITLEKEIAKYRDILLNLLHPAGMKVLGRDLLKMANNYTTSMQEGLQTGHSFSYYTGGIGQATMTTDFVNQSTNTVVVTGIGSEDLQGIVPANSYLKMTNANGDIIFSKVLSVIDVITDDLLLDTGSEDIQGESGSEDLLISGSNQITLQDSTWLTFANVANVVGTAGSSQINIVSLTGSYDIVNNGNYSNTDYPLKDIVRAGDKILVPNNSVLTVSSVNYTTNNGIIFLNGTLTNTTNGYMSVNRTFVASSDKIEIIGSIGTQYSPELVDQGGNNITTQAGSYLVLG
jgi:hypothetical protein